MYPTDPTSIHVGFNLVKLIDGRGIGFLYGAFLMKDE